MHRSRMILGLAFPDADSLGGTGGDAVRTASAFVFLQRHRVVIAVHRFSLRSIRISTRVPAPGALTMLRPSEFRFIFGRPMPEPKPRLRISSEGGGITFLHREIEVRDARAFILHADMDQFRGDVDVRGPAAGVNDHIDLRLVHGDDGPPDDFRRKAELFQCPFCIRGSLAGANEIISRDVVMEVHHAAPERSRCPGFLPG